MPATIEVHDKRRPAKEDNRVMIRVEQITAVFAKEYTVTGSTTPVHHAVVTTSAHQAIDTVETYDRVMALIGDA